MNVIMIFFLNFKNRKKIYKNEYYFLILKIENKNFIHNVD